MCIFVIPRSQKQIEKLEDRKNRLKTERKKKVSRALLQLRPLVIKALLKMTATR